MVSQIRWIIGAVELGGDSLDCRRKANCITIRHGYATESTVATRHSSSTGPESLLAPSANSSVAVSQEKTAPPSRYVLPKDLDAAIRHLDDQQLDRLVSVALEERARRRKPPVPANSQRKRDAGAVFPSMPQGKLNAVRAAFKAGVTPARIAREFGISRSDVQKTLAGDVKK